MNDVSQIVVSIVTMLGVVFAGAGLEWIKGVVSKARTKNDAAAAIREDAAAIRDELREELERKREELAEVFEELEQTRREFNMLVDDYLAVKAEFIVIFGILSPAARAGVISDEELTEIRLWMKRIKESRLLKPRKDLLDTTKTGQ